MKLSDTLEEQTALEARIEDTKPAIPPECRHLGFLLFTPFRYSPYPFDSRFRRKGSSLGVFYAAEAAETAIAEKVFYRLLFFSESPATPWPKNPGEYTAFAAQFATDYAADLTTAPWLAQRASWVHPTDYSQCLDFADACRAAALEAIRYESVRDPAARANIALLTCQAFTQTEAVALQTWHFHFSNAGVRAICEFPQQMIEFEHNSFANDPRVAGMVWNRN
jgi:RES domain